MLHILSNMKKYIIDTFALIAMASMQSSWSQDAYEGLSSAAIMTCNNEPQTQCWKPLADRLDQLKAPETKQQRQDVLIAYWMLAKAAHSVGDLYESKKIFDITLKLASDARSSGLAEEESSFIRLEIGYDRATLALSMHDYASALRDLDGVSSFIKEATQNGPEPDSVMLSRAAALIGLGQTSEADATLGTLLKTLKYDGQSPWEGFPIGPQPLNPYETGRRIAAHYLRERRFEDALTLLETLKSEREKTLANLPNERVRGEYWARLTKAADILDDKAGVYSAMGNDDQAEQLLKASILEREKTRNRQLRSTLEQLSAVEKRKGNAAEANDLAQRAASIKAEKAPSDPLGATLGFVN